jgi:adenylate cyclase
MNIQQQNGIVSTISFSPFDETSKYIELRNGIFREAIEKSHITPINHVDIFDESILTFACLNEALDFLVSILRITSRKEQDSGNNINNNISIKSSLCMGDYFIHQDQIYGEAVNFATRLSYASRKNEMLLSRIDHNIIDQYILTHPDVTYFIRDDEDNSISIAIDDEDITKAQECEMAFKVEFDHQSKVFRSSRNIIIQIGRSGNSDIFIDSDQISRNHATIQLNYNKIYLEDHSSNGTYVYIDDREIFLSHEKLELSSNGHISCGVSMYSSIKPSSLISFQLCDISTINSQQINPDPLNFSVKNKLRAI